VNFLWDNIFRKSEKDADARAALKENLLFRDLTERELNILEDIVHIRKYHAGEPIFRQGEVGVGMYIIMKGRVEIFVTDPAAQSDEARDIFITQLLPSDFFGELSLVEENGRRTASAVAREETTLVGFFKPDLVEMRARSPQTGIKIVFRLAEVLGRRLKDTTEKVSELRRALRDLRLPPMMESQNGSEASRNSAP
jgi:CRP/FNR family cyclic AMP-dependent transcriptional regulator